MTSVLHHDETECQGTVNIIGSCILGIQYIAGILELIPALLAALIGKLESIKQNTQIPKYWISQTAKHAKRDCWMMNMRF